MITLLGTAMSKRLELICFIAGAWVVLAGSVPASAERGACWPILSVKQPRLSDTMINLKRYWSATLEVNATVCVESAGTFDLRTRRSMENGVDFTVTEPVAWGTRQTDIVLELWTDEAVIDFRIARIRPCTCRF